MQHITTDYQNIISSFVNKYGLTRGQVVAEIEKTFSSMLSQWYRQDVVAMFSENQLIAFGYHRNSSETIQVPIELTTMRGWNTIKRILDENLSNAACLEIVKMYKRKEHRIYWGEIIKKDNKSNFIVEIELEPGDVVYATCLSNHLGVHERKVVTVGQKRAFHIRRIDPVIKNNIPKVKVLVDRVSKYLVEGLIRLKLDSTFKIRCTKRYVGQKSFVESSAFIPKTVILDVSRELSEHIQVTIKKT